MVKLRGDQGCSTDKENTFRSNNAALLTDQLDWKKSHTAGGSETNPHLWPNGFLEVLGSSELSEQTQSKQKQAKYSPG